MSRVSRQEWVKRVERWAESGLTAREFASELGCNPKTLQYWKYRLGREVRQGSPDMATRATNRRNGAAPVAFVELASLAHASASVELVLRGGAVRLLVPANADLAALTRLVDALAVTP